MEAGPWSKPGPALVGRRRLWRIVRWTAVVALVVVLLLRVVSARYGVGLFARPFDRERWLEGENYARSSMVWNLVLCHLEEGMPHAEVRELLGPPDAYPPIVPRQRGDEIYMLVPTQMEGAGFLWWGLTSSSDTSGEDVGKAFDTLRFRALVIAFDEAGLLRRFEIEEFPVTGPRPGPRTSAGMAHDR